MCVRHKYLHVDCTVMMPYICAKYHTIREREKAMLSGVFLQTMQYSMNHTFGSYHLSEAEAAVH